MHLLSPYHPLRVSQLSPIFRRDCEEYRKTVYEYEMNVEREDGAQVILIGRAKEREIPLSDNMAFSDLQGMLAKMELNHQEIIRFVKFWDGPRQIFNFDNNLAQLLANTDVADVPWNSLHFPYGEFYLHFGCVLESSLDIQGRVYKAEGAYVHVQGGPSFIDGFLPSELCTLW